MKNYFIKSVIFFCGLIIFSINIKAGQEKYLDTDHVDIYGYKSTLSVDLSKIKHSFFPDYSKIKSEYSDIYFIHRFTEEAQKNYLYQNLGVRGSASKHLYDSFLVKSLEDHSGYNSYSLFLPSDDDIEFFDTKSPYVNLDLVLARFGTFYSSILFSRNINPFWNFGFSGRSIISQKEFLEDTHLQKSDRAIVANNFSFFSSFVKPETGYLAFFRFFFSKHKSREHLPIYVIPGYDNKNVSNKLFLNIKDAPLNDLHIANKINFLGVNGYFSHPENSEKVFDWTFYQQFIILPKLAVYLNANINMTSNLFEYRNREKDDEVKKSKDLDSLSSFDKDQILKENLIRLGISDHREAEYSHFMDDVNYSAELGIKKEISRFFLMPYYRIKFSDIRRGVGQKLKLTVDEKYLKNNFIENFFGFYGSLPLKVFKKDLLHFKLEYELKNFYMANLGYSFGNANILLSTKKMKSPMIYESFQWFGRNWENNFKKTLQHVAEASYSFKKKKFSITPFGKIFFIQNPFYFEQREITNNEKKLEGSILSNREEKDLKRETPENRENIMNLNPTQICHPIQKEGDFCFGYLGAKTFTKIWKIVCTSFFSVKKEFSKLEIINAPSFIANGTICYEYNYSDKESGFVTGLDVSYKSSYYGDGYDPVIRQFFLQKKFEIFSYPIFDIFFNLKIDRFKIFIKWSHINEFMNKTKGYFSSPFYPGNKMALDIGVKWNFFD